MSVLSGRHKSQGHNFKNISLQLNQLHNLGKCDCSFLSIWMNYNVHNLFFLPSSPHAWVAAYINFMTNEGGKKIPSMPGFQELPVCELLDHVTLNNSYSMNALGQRPCFNKRWLTCRARIFKTIAEFEKVDRHCAKWVSTSALPTWVQLPLPTNESFT